MANNDKGLYLPLKINLTEWEQSLTKADADFQRAMNEMKSANKDLVLRYDVEIAGAKAAGNDVKVMELETAKLNRLLEVQKQELEALNRAYEKTVKSQGASSDAAQALAKNLVAQSKAVERTQAQLDAKGLNLGKRLSDSLASFSPQFAAIRNVTQDITGGLSSMGAAAGVAAKAIGGIGLAASGFAAIYTGLEKATKYVNDMAAAGVNASDPIYQLRESLQSTYEDAEYLYGVTRVDGTNAESLANALVKLDAALLNDSEGTSRATLTLQKYGAELRNADGSVKTYREQLQELSRAAQTAAAAGQFAEFKAGLPKAFATTQFDHLLLGLENYAKQARIASNDSKILYGELHSVTDWTNTLALAQQRLDAIKGGAYAPAAIENLKQEVDTQVAIANVLEKNKKKYADAAKAVGNITNEFTKLKGAAVIAFESIRNDASKFSILDSWKNAGPFQLITNGIMKLRDAYKQVEEEQTAVADKRKLEEARQDDIKLNKIDNTVDTKKEDQKEEQAQKAALDRQKAAQEQFQRELRDLRSTEYEREINQLNDRVEKWRQANISEVDIAARAALEKEAIDKKYYDKQQAELQRQTKAQEAEYNKQVEVAKKAREASISDAEATLRNNLKLMRYIQAEQKKGTYSDDKARDYANKLYLRQNGFRQSDITALQNFGTERLKELGNARDRLFAGFAGPPVASGSTNNVNITNNFDGTVVEDVAAMDKLANKVAEIITPAIQQALRGGTQYGY